MSLNGVCFSVVLKELWVASSFVPARTELGGMRISPILWPATAAPAMAPAPTRNWRRLRYRSFGVISAEAISAGFLINIYGSCPTQMRALSIFIFVSIPLGGFRYKADAQGFFLRSPRAGRFLPQNHAVKLINPDESISCESWYGVPMGVNKKRRRNQRRNGGVSRQRGILCPAGDRPDERPNHRDRHVPSNSCSIGAK